MSSILLNDCTKMANLKHSLYEIQWSGKHSTLTLSLITSLVLIMAEL